MANVLCRLGILGPPDELSNRTALAISHDEGITWKPLTEPLPPLGKPGSYDAGLTGSVDVLRDRCERIPDVVHSRSPLHVRFGNVNRGIVYTGHAMSMDGIHWVKDSLPALSPRQDSVHPYEAVVSKSSVLLIHGTYHMWFSIFSMEGRGYRLGYAKSQDDIHWQRILNNDVLPLTPGGFDSQNQSYANVIEQGDELWMFYAGNSFGATGIGLATMKKSTLGK